MKQKTPKKPGKVIPTLVVLSMLFLSGLGCGFDPYQLLPEQLFPEQTLERFPPAIESRIISQSFLGSVVWRRNDILIRHFALPSPELLAGHGYVAFVDFIGGPESKINQLNVLDADSGATLWQSEHFSHYEAIAIGDDKVFVLLFEGSPLNIYDIKDGNEPLASFNYFKEATRLFFMFPVVAEENIYLYYNQGNEYSLHHVDLEGKEIDAPRKIQISEFSSSLFLFDEPFILKTGEGQYIGANFETGKELWRLPAPGRIDSWPVLRDDMLIISAGDGVRYLLMAVDTQGGHRLWETEKVFGPSVVLHQDSLYALRNDAALVRLDFTTGQVEEEIPFEPAAISAGKWAYLLASDGERLFVYFGDSQELFALKTAD